MYKKILSLFFLLCVGVSSNAEVDSKISSYVDTLLNKSFGILRDNAKSTSQKIVESEALMTENMDLQWMSKFVLGRYRRTLTPDQVADFTKLYSIYVVKSYGNGVKSFNNEQVKVKSQQQINAGGDYVVKTLLIRPDLEPLEMDYLVRDTKNGLKVFDVVTEGISLINSHQAEFTNAISNHGFDYLITELKQKIQSLDDGMNNGNPRK
jgi:phospholipid transport system substrate-binding protein